MSCPSWKPSGDSSESTMNYTYSMTVSIADAPFLSANLSKSPATSPTYPVANTLNAATTQDVAMLGSTSPSPADVPMPSPMVSTNTVHMPSRSASFTSNASMASIAPVVEGNPSTSTFDFIFPDPIVAYAPHRCSELGSMREMIDKNQQGYTPYPVSKAESAESSFGSLFSPCKTPSTIETSTTVPGSLTSGAVISTSDVAAITLNTLQGSPSSGSLSEAILSSKRIEAEGDSDSKGKGTEFCCYSPFLQHRAAAISRTPTPFVTGESASHTPAPSFAVPRTIVETDNEFLIIQGLNKHELFEFVHSGTLREWEATPIPKVVIFIAGDTIVTGDQLHNRVVAIRNALKKIFPESDPIVGSAEPVHHSESNFRPVFPYLISGISIHQAQVLTTRLYWPMCKLTFFALDLSPPPTSFVMTLSGFHLPLKVESNAAVASLIRRRLFASTSVTSIIMRYHDNLPPYLTRDELIQFVLGTVEVKGVRLGNHEECPVVFNVYIHPPTNNPYRHRMWLQEVQSMIFFTTYGTGRVAAIFHCDSCKGRDHAVESCPFPMPWQQFSDLNDVEDSIVGIDDPMEDMYAITLHFKHI